MDLHAFSSNEVVSQRDGRREKEKYPIIFPFEETCDASWIRQSDVRNQKNRN